MKIKELAEELNITPQAIQKRMSSIKGFREQHTKKVSNRVVIDPAGVEILKKAIANKQETSKTNSSTNELTEDVISILREQLKVKDEQISNRDYQIAALTSELSKANSQIRELTTGEHPTIEMNDNKQAAKKKGFWNKLRAAFSDDNIPNE